MRAILVYINIKHKTDLNFYLAETEELMKTADYEPILTIGQSANSLDPKTAVRSGKLQEIKDAIALYDIEAIIFYNNLTFAMQNELYRQLAVKIVDRSHLILDIFALNAFSKEAKLQIKLARLSYALDERVKELGAEDQSGRLYNKGAGESRSALKLRQNKKRINNLKKELLSLEKKNNEKKRHRNKLGLKKVALVGYTNVGKSLLMKALLSEKDRAPLSKDSLFATLDVTARKATIDNYAYLLFDTVGFVSDLPHELIAAFKSTLSAAKEADLLLLIIDASQDIESQRTVALNTLKTINADHIPLLEVHNKIDLLSIRNASFLEISALTKEGIDELKKSIINKLCPDKINAELLLPYAKINLINKYNSLLNFQSFENKDNGILTKLSGEEKFVKMFISEAEE